MESFVVSRCELCLPAPKKMKNESLRRCLVQSRLARLLIWSPGGSTPERSRPRRQPQRIPGTANQHSGAHWELSFTDQVNRKVCADCDKNTSPLSDILAFIGSLTRICPADWVFAASAEASNPASDDHHPEEPTAVSVRLRVLSVKVAYPS
jgi:hypothetical protein